ncbi:hypothetical protein F5I97DRAFT_1929280 [Phlebopus sp. FC_14]|nr:hypothetical protein F5I97DRAFT_1929280 [Phlebopus sp. FC_14]
MVEQPASASDYVDVLLVGQTGVGKSTVINMIRGVQEGSNGSAEVKNDVRPCTVSARDYRTTLDGREFRLWDTRGLDEALEHPNNSDQAVGWLRRVLRMVPACDRELKDHCQRVLNDRPSTLLIWCIDASKISIPAHWQQFRKVYVDFCGRRVAPAVVVTRVPQNWTVDWKGKCKEQLEKLGLGLEIRDDLFAGVVRHPRSYASTRMYDTDSQTAVRNVVLSWNSNR